MAEKPPQYPGMSNEELTTHLFYRLYNEDSTQPRLVSRHGVNSCDPTLGSIHIDRIPPPFTIAVLLDAICTAEGITRDTAKKATIYLPGKKSPAKLKEVLEIIGTAVAPIGSDRGRPFLVVFHGPVPGVVAPETSAQGFQSASQPTAPAPLDAYPPVTTQPAPTPAPRADGWFTQALIQSQVFYRLYNEDPTQPQIVSHHGADPDDPAVGSIHINRIPPPFTVAVLRDAICAAEGISGNAVKKATLYFPGKTTPAKPKEVVEIIGSASVPISSDRSRPFLVVFHEPIPVAGSSGTPVQGAHIPAAVTNSTTTSAPVATQPRPTRAPRVDGWFTKGVEYNPVAYPKPPEPELDACDHIAVGAYSCAYSFGNNQYWGIIIAFPCLEHEVIGAAQPKFTPRPLSALAPSAHQSFVSSSSQRNMADKPPQYAAVDTPTRVTHSNQGCLEVFYRLYNEDPTQPRLISRHGVDSDDPTVGSIHIDRIAPPFTIAILRDAICAAEGISGNAAKKATIYLPGRVAPAKPKEVLEIIGATSAPIGSDIEHPFLLVFHEPIALASSSGTSVQTTNTPPTMAAPTPAPARQSLPVTTQPAPTLAPRAEGWFTQAVEFDQWRKDWGKPRPQLGACAHFGVAIYTFIYSTFSLVCCWCVCNGHCEDALKVGCGCPRAPDGP
ncbi:hypothetical protein DL93DRAFT_2164722 [Clavulina sp. PMI_390]|nr:hypothetical protein DL93DRAFT_2164722 [Clavulina sp. PMI_390]